VIHGRYTASLTNALSYSKLSLNRWPEAIECESDSYT